MDYWWVTNSMYVQVQDYGQNKHYDYTWRWVDPCIDKTTPPTSLPPMIVPLTSKGFPRINPIASGGAAFGFCHCSINLSVTKGGVPFVNPAIFVYPGLTRATNYVRLATEFVVSPPYDLTLLGFYQVTVNYQWSRTHVSSFTFQIEFVDPCVLACVPPYLPAIISITGWNQVF